MRSPVTRFDKVPVEEIVSGYDPEMLAKHIEDKMSRKKREYFKSALRKTTLRMSLIPKMVSVLKSNRVFM